MMRNGQSGDAGANDGDVHGESSSMPSQRWVMRLARDTDALMKAIDKPIAFFVPLICSPYRAYPCADFHDAATPPADRSHTQGRVAPWTIADVEHETGIGKDTLRV